MTQDCRLIIGFHGLAGSGKSEAARRLIERHGFVRGKFAGALKEMLRAYLRYRGAPDDLIERMVEGDIKETPSPYLSGRTPRHAMQTLGTEWGRHCIDTDLWVDTEMEHQRNAARVVFDDVRFDNETAAIRKAGGILIRVDRPGAGSASGAGHASEGQALPADLTIANGDSLAGYLAEVDRAVITASWAVAGIRARS